jgi:hypothetical protein
MAGILKYEECQTVDGSTPDRYWNELKKFSQSIIEQGLHPILLVETRVHPSWIADWCWPSGSDEYERPVDLHVTRGETEASSQYIIHFNQIAVYRAPLGPGASFLLPCELLKKIAFTRFGSGYPVEVSYESTENHALVNLILKWSQKVDLERYPMIKLQYHS